MILLLHAFTQVFASEHLKTKRMLAAGACTEIDKLLTEYEKNMDKWMRPEPSQVKMDLLMYVFVSIILSYC